MKKAQFFLLAALVIVVIIIALATVNIGTRTSRENFRIFDLTKEIDLEGKSVVDFGIFTEVSGGATGQNIEDLLTFYAEANPGSDITIIVGDNEGYLIVNATTIDLGEDCVGIICTPQQGRRVTVTEGSGNIAQVHVGTDEPITFDLGEEGQSFFVVIAAESEDKEITVATSTAPET